MANPYSDVRSDGGEIVRLLEQIIINAVERRASDIHLEPKDDRVRVRLRVDGVLVEQRALSLRLMPALISRVKVLASLDIAEKRLPQDGTFKMGLGQGDLEVTVRVSSFPSLTGEKIVLRLLMGASTIPLEGLGMAPQQRDALKRIIQMHSGLLLVTGPTGSGKTSTLYALIQALDTNTRNVVTLEDPIEVELPAVTQAQVAPKVGFDFARGLRAVLRQDPDVILVGEMRDLETARIAVQASLTGHLVLSTLHTSSVVETMTRLVDMGLDRNTVANALVGIVSQRLVRKVCARCVDFGPADPSAGQLLGVEFEPDTMLAKVAGCPRCIDTGYRGRMGLFEVLEMDDELRFEIKERSSPRELKSLLSARDVMDLRSSGIRAITAGFTTWQEVLRVT